MNFKEIPTTNLQISFISRSHSESRTNQTIFCGLPLETSAWGQVQIIQRFKISSFIIISESLKQFNISNIYVSQLHKVV